MHLLPRQIRKETCIYYSDKSIEEFRQDLYLLFSKSLSERLSINLTGEFKSRNDFLLTKQFSVSFAGTSSWTSIKVKMQPEAKRTRLELRIKPHPHVYLFAIVFPIAGLFFGWQIMLGETMSWEIVLLLVLLIIIFPVAGCFYGQVAKDNLRNTFVKHFDLKRQ